MGTQTSWIVGGMLVGFIVFITLRGELPQYQSAIFGGGAAATPPSTPGAAYLSGLGETLSGIFNHLPGTK